VKACRARAAGGKLERSGGLVEEERADAELEEEERARGRRRGGGGGEEGVPGGRGREVLRERGVRGVVAQPRAPRAARLQPPRELVAAPVLAQQLRCGRRHPRGGLVACSGRFRTPGSQSSASLPCGGFGGPDFASRSLDAGQPEKADAGRVVTCFRLDRRVRFAAHPN